MSTFTAPADLRMLDDYRFELLAPFEYHVGDYPSHHIICVPKGFVTDLASIPQALWSIFPPHGRWAKAAILHDWLYVEATGTKAEADQIFNEAMGVLGVPPRTRWLMHQAVKHFGRGNF